MRPASPERVHKQISAKFTTGFYAAYSGWHAHVSLPLGVNSVLGLGSFSTSKRKWCRVLHAPHLVQMSPPSAVETQPVTGTGTAAVESAHSLANLPEGPLQQTQINETVNLSPTQENESPSPAKLPDLDIQRCLLRVPAGLLQTATDGDWRKLSRKIRQTDQNYCLFCGQWLARPTYLSRHIQSQPSVLAPGSNSPCQLARSKAHGPQQPL